MRRPGDPRSSYRLQTSHRITGLCCPSYVRVVFPLDESDVMGLSGKLGLIKEGQLADLLLVDGDPLADVGILRDRKNLRVIMKDGVFHKRPAARHLSFEQAAE